MLQLKSNIKHIHSIWGPSSSASNGLLAYFVQHLNYYWGWRVGHHRASREGRWRFVWSYITRSWADRHMGSESQTKKVQQRNPEKNPPSLCSLSCSSPLNPPSTDQHMWWRMTHLFFYKGCVYVKLLKCIKMSSTLGGPPRLSWKITRWKYNFSAGESGIWTEFCLSLSLSLFLSPFSLYPVFFFACSFSSPLLGSYSFSILYSVSAHSTIKVEHVVRVCGFTMPYNKH